MPTVITPDRGGEGSCAVEGVAGPSPSGRRTAALLAGSAAVLGAAAVLGLGLGSHAVQPAHVVDALVAYDPGDDEHLIVVQSRLPRIVLGILVWQEGGEAVLGLIVLGAAALAGLAYWLVRRKRAGKPHLLDPARLGDVLDIGPGFGELVLPARVQGAWLFLAAGSGITPCEQGKRWPEDGLRLKRRRYHLPYLAALFASLENKTKTKARVAARRAGDPHRVFAGRQCLLTRRRLWTSS